MRILIIDTDYEQFLESLYERNPELSGSSYAEQAAAREEQLFGIAPSYAEHLRRLGHEAATISLNHDLAQRAWALEHGAAELRALTRIERGAARPFGRALRAVTRRVPQGGRRRPSWRERVLIAQVRRFAPDVLVCLDMVTVDPQLLWELRDTVNVVVGQHAATPLRNLKELGCYDLFVSSVPALVTKVRSAGIRAEALRLAFDPDVLLRVPEQPRVHDVSFVGSLFSGLHDSRTQQLERLCEHFDGMTVWSSSLDGLAASSPIRRRYAGPAWGLDMFRVMRSSRITVNRHIDFFGAANNLRLYEATGCGTLLVTDARSGLGDLFDIGTEVVAYETVDQCIELIEAHLSDEEARAAIARGGHERTLREHTFDARMEELLELIRSSMRNRRSAQTTSASGGMRA
jgi:spore maturation protein CgeB